MHHTRPAASFPTAAASAPPRALLGAVVQALTPLPAPAGCGLQLPAGLAAAPGTRALGGFGRLRRWARARRSGGVAWLAVAEQPRARWPAAARSEAVRLAGGLADRLGAPQVPGAPAPSGGIANFRASGGVEAGTEAAARVRLWPGPGRLREEGGWSDAARRGAGSAWRPGAPLAPPAGAGARGSARGSDVCRASAVSTPAALPAAPGRDCRNGAARHQGALRAGGRPRGQPRESWVLARERTCRQRADRLALAALSFRRANCVLASPRRHRVAWLRACAEVSASPQVSRRQGCSLTGSARAARGLDGWTGELWAACGVVV